MVLTVVSDNDLINNKKLAFTTFTSRNPTPHPPDKDTADSGSSHFYFAPGAPVMNYDATAPTIGVGVANGTPVHSIVSGELASVTALPPASRKGHVIAGFPHSLIGLAPFVHAGCRVLFTNTSVIAFDKDGNVILEGWHETTGPKLGTGRSSQKNYRRPTCPTHNSSLGLAHTAHKWKPSMQYVPLSHHCAPALSSDWCSPCHQLRAQSRLPPRVDILPLILDGLTYLPSLLW
jgi:hypothetical protein